MADTEVVAGIHCSECPSTKGLLLVTVVKLDLAGKDGYPEFRELCSECVHREYFCHTHRALHICGDHEHGLRHVCGCCLALEIHRLLPGAWVPMVRKLEEAGLSRRLAASGQHAAGTEFIGLSMNQKALYGLYLHAHMLALSPDDLLEGYVASAMHRAH